MTQETRRRKLKKGVHTFVVCAFGESPFLEECIRSLKAQTVSGEVIMVTSTPNSHIGTLAEKYELPLYVNEGEGGIAQDWNFGIAKCDSRFVTIAHQDDIYEKNYLEACLSAAKKSKNPQIIFTDYGEIRGGKTTKKSRLLAVKRILISPMRCQPLRGVPFVKRRVLSLGNPICCPSVTYCMEHLKKPVFAVKYGSNLDWQTWADLARAHGEFVYVAKPLMYHRIHGQSATSGLIENHQRTKEDLDMLRQFWPEKIAKIIAKWYAKGETLNSE